MCAYFVLLCYTVSSDILDKFYLSVIIMVVVTVLKLCLPLLILNEHGLWHLICNNISTTIFNDYSGMFTAFTVCNNLLHFIFKYVYYVSGT